eukprot:m.991824 g.991824  ORF g.991824 m.991824 type:complete len:323 (-) comp24003_c0_seq83:302-1270(-)
MHMHTCAHIHTDTHRNLQMHRDAYMHPGTHACRRRHSFGHARPCAVMLCARPVSAAVCGLTPSPRCADPQQPGSLWREHRRRRLDGPRARAAAPRGGAVGRRAGGRGQGVWRQLQHRRAAAAVPGARDRAADAHSGAGRGDGQRGHAHRPADPARAARALCSVHRAHNRTPSQHDRRRRPPAGAGRGHGLSRSTCSCACRRRLPIDRSRACYIDCKTVNASASPYRASACGTCWWVRSRCLVYALCRSWKKGHPQSCRRSQAVYLHRCYGRLPPVGMQTKGCFLHLTSMYRLKTIFISSAGAHTRDPYAHRRSLCQHMVGLF